MMEPFIGSVVLFAGNFAPRGWAFCNGQLLPISQNQALFSILGTTYGGDGRTTFALPDLRGRAPIHWGQGPGLSNFVLGQQSGAETVTLTTAQLPAHTHGTSFELPLAEAPTTPTPTVPIAYDRHTMPTASVIQSQATGGGQPVSIASPGLSLSFIIALEGVFPSRG